MVKTFLFFFSIIALQLGCGTITTKKFSHLGGDQNFVNTFFFWLLHYNMGVDQLQQKTLVAQVAIEIWLIFLFYSVVVTLTRVWTGCD